MTSRRKREITEPFGQRLRSRRKELGLSMRALGAKCKVSPQAVCNWERGDRSISAENLLTLSQFLQLDPFELMGMNGAYVHIPISDPSRLGVALDALDGFITRRRMKLTGQTKAKLLLYLCGIEGELPKDDELMRLSTLAQ